MIDMDGLETCERSSSPSSPETNITTPEAASIDDDIWASDHEHESTSVLSNPPNHQDMLSDLPTIKRQHMTDGYREGLAVGKAKVMQEGFDDGYPIGVSIAMRAGKILGVIEGILAARDIDAESKVGTKKIFERAKQELSMTALMKDMNDQVLMSNDSTPASIEMVLQKWETLVIGDGASNGGESRR